MNKKPTVQRITANLPDVAALTKAKVAAAKANKPLSVWAGDEIVKALKNQTKSK